MFQYPQTDRGFFRWHIIAWNKALCLCFSILRRIVAFSGRRVLDGTFPQYSVSVSSDGSWLFQVSNVSYRLSSWRFIVSVSSDGSWLFQAKRHYSCCHYVTRNVSVSSDGSWLFQLHTKNNCSHIGSFSILRRIVAFSGIFPDYKWAWHLSFSILRRIVAFSETSLLRNCLRLQVSVSSDGSWLFQASVWSAMTTRGMAVSVSSDGSWLFQGDICRYTGICSIVSVSSDGSWLFQAIAQLPNPLYNRFQYPQTDRGFFRSKRWINFWIAV